MIKIGVIGYGFSANTFHLPFIKHEENLQLVSISTSKEDMVREKYPDVLIYDNAMDLIQKSDAELVVITAPNDVHYDLAKICLNNGKHVILEKPMVTSSKQGEELCALAKANGLILSVFHNRRWDGDFLTVKKLIEDGSLGKIHFFESHIDRFRPIARDRWRERAGPGSGIWVDLGAHLLDQTLSLFGSPDAITARCLISRDNSETTDYFHVLLHYSNCEVILHGSSFSAGPNLRFHLQGTKGSFIKYGLDPQEEQLIKGSLPNMPAFGREDANCFGVLYTEKDNIIVPTETGCYQSYYTGIANAIMGNSIVPVRAEEAVQVVKLLEIAELSNRLGKTIQI